MNWCWPVVEPCYNYGLSYLCVKVGHIWKLKKNLVLLTSALDKLSAERDVVLNRVNAGELKGEQRLATVGTWLSQVETIETHTNLLIEVASSRNASSQDVSERLSTYGCWFLTCDLGEEVFKKLTQVQSLSGAGQEFQEVTEQPPPPVVQVKICPKTVGLDTTLKKTWKSLRRDETRMLGIYGMGGVGKTTLLTLINNKFVEVKNEYDVVVWVESSKDADVGKIQDAIGERLHICDNNWSTYSRTEKAGEISRVLRDMKPRFVLLLDDLWEDVSLTAIGIPVLGRKYKVVFTTRSKDVCSVMGANEDIQVQCLSETDAWDLFDMKVKCDGLNNEISGIAKKIVAKCCGLPLALEVIRKTMASKSTVIQWGRALDTLESYPSEMKGTEKGIFQVLKLSYDYLETKNAKCFLYCALFPKAYYIKQDELVEYWIGEGFIDEKDGRGRAKDRCYEIIDNLVGAGLLLESNKKVYMHDMIRDMALWIVSEFRDGERFVVRTDAGLSQLPDVTDWTTVTKMSLINNEIKNIPDDPEFPDQTNLVTLFLQNNKLVDIVGRFFQVLSTLVVLDLSWNLQITELPKGISELVSLRLLNLSGTSIKYLPEVAAAALDSCLLKILEQLKGLQLLTVTVNNDSVLEEFLGSTRLAGITHGLYLEGLKVPFAAIGELSSLHKLEMVNCDITESGTEWEGKRRDQYSPSTSSSEITQSNPWFKDLSAVVINSCIHLKDLTWLVYAANLESLSVESSPKMTEIINKEKAACVGVDPFQELQVLRLHYLKELGSIYGSQVSFPKLKLNKVDIENCPNLHQRPFKRNRAVVNEEDRISQLPEALILQILSLLPTKDVIATSVLSKQWQSLWKMVPILMFDSCDHKRKLGTFSKDVCKTLHSHKAPILQSLHLDVDFDTCTAIDIGILLGIAFGRNVRKLLLDVYPENNKSNRPFNFPPTLLYTFETLETLILRFHALVDVPSQICLKSLKTLHLDYMYYEDDESVCNLLSGCPFLETLVVSRAACGDGITTFIIEVPSLQSLSIHDENDGVDHWEYVINAPSLKYLHIDLEKGSEVCLSETSLELVKAKISCVTINEKLLGSLTSVKMLSLLFWPPLEVKYPTGSIFYRLVYLEVYTGKPAWWNLLMFMLDTSPNLQVLKLLIDQWHKIEDHVVCEKWNQPMKVPECLLLHLETFVWEGYEGKRKEEKEVAKYILRNTSRLKKVTFSKTNCSSEKRLEMLEELASVVKTSSSCQFEFE
ncbi:F-box domain [Arabidopsis suecica]|uniref:F-box domain n=1 Tax=Arabidopsis suecica TaxID=45249 RepID=A0A8T1XN21_ARASU|nr:F-box domain [Arabidopsis suecica]